MRSDGGSVSQTEPVVVFLDVRDFVVDSDHSRDSGGFRKPRRHRSCFQSPQQQRKQSSRDEKLPDRTEPEREDDTAPLKTTWTLLWSLSGNSCSDCDPLFSIGGQKHDIILFYSTIAGSLWMKIRIEKRFTTHRLKLWPYYLWDRVKETLWAEHKTKDQVNVKYIQVINDSQFMSNMINSWLHSEYLIMRRAGNRNSVPNRSEFLISSTGFIWKYIQVLHIGAQMGHNN